MTLITNDQIRRLQTEARLAGDVIMSDTCALALSTPYEDGDSASPTLEQVEDARYDCARAIEEAHAAAWSGPSTTAGDAPRA